MRDVADYALSHFIVLGREDALVRLYDRYLKVAYYLTYWMLNGVSICRKASLYVAKSGIARYWPLAVAH